MKCRELVAFLRDRGWVEERNTKGSHLMFRFPSNGKMFVIPTSFRDTHCKTRNYVSMIKRLEQ